jgi:hypothetical protein
MFRFTIRDVLWLMVVVAMGAWLAGTNRRIATMEAAFMSLQREISLRDEDYMRRFQALHTEIQIGPVTQYPAVPIAPPAPAQLTPPAPSK